MHPNAESPSSCSSSTNTFTFGRTAMLGATLVIALTFAGAASAEAPTFDKRCLADPKACMGEGPLGEEAETPVAAEPEAEAAPEEATTAEFAASGSGDPWKATPELEATETQLAPPLDYSRCVEISVRAGNGLDESSRVCAAVFGKS